MNDEALKKYVNLMMDKISQVSASDWKKPWFAPKGGLPQNLSGRQYSGLNTMMLFLAMEKYNHKLPVFLTFSQIQSEKIFINKGSKAFPVLYYELSVKHNLTGKKITYDDYKKLPESNKEEYTVRPYMKHYNVFNIEQTNYKELYPEKYAKIEERLAPPTLAECAGKSNAIMDKMIEEQKWVCPINLEAQDRAYYSTSKDNIVLPTVNQFENKESFYMTALHEMAHSTGHESRLNRDIKNGFGTSKYAKEEITAELTSAVAGVELGIYVSPRKENAQYLKSWLGAVNDDPKFLISVMRDVGKASDMITDKTRELEKEDSSTQENNTERREEKNTSTVTTQENCDIRYKGGRREITITGDTATIKTNGQVFDATGVLSQLKSSGIDIKSVTPEQWSSILKGQGTVVDAAHPKMLFSIQKQVDGYSLRVANLTRMSRKIKQNSL